MNDDRTWRSAEMEELPPSTLVEYVRYVHTSGEWPPGCYRTVTTEDGLIRAWFIADRVPDFDDLPPRIVGETTSWWRPAEVNRD